MSGCAFSISSSSSTQYGCLVTPSVSRPPWSNRHSPEARRSGGSPHGAPCIRTCRSAGARRRRQASWRATSVLPTPVGPENRKEPIGLRGAEPAARHLDAADQRVDRLVLAEHDVLQVAVERLQHTRSSLGHGSAGCARSWRRSPRSRFADGLLRFDFGRIFCAARRPRRSRRSPCPADDGR